LFVVQVKTRKEPEGAKNTLIFFCQEWDSKIVQATAKYNFQSLDTFKFIGITATFTVVNDRMEMRAVDQHAQKLLDFHVSATLAALAALAEIVLLPKSFPWAFSCSLFSESTLASMKAEWEAVLQMEAKIASGDDSLQWVYDGVPITRSQAYRYIMITLEEVNWKHDERTREIVLSLEPTLQSSVPIEWVYNDLRDTEKRFCKNTSRTSAAQMQCMVQKSLAHRLADYGFKALFAFSHMFGVLA
jgi:hypothetical protein